MPGPSHSSQTDAEGLHRPKGFDAASNDTALIKDIAGNLVYRDLDLLGGTGPVGPAGPSLSAWVTATDYIVGNTLYSDVVDSTENRIYRCIVSHTSGASLLLDIANWTELSEEFLAARTSMSTGLLTGCVLSINAGDSTKFDMTAGTGTHVDHTTTPGLTIETPVMINAIIAGTPDNIATETITFICFDISGTLIDTNVESTPTDRRNLIVVGAVSHPDNINITSVFQNPNIPTDAANQAQDLMQALGFFSTSGNHITGNVGTMTINKGSGAGFDRSRNYAANPKDPHNFPMADLPTATLFQILRDGAPFAISSTIDPTQYDNGGVLTTVPGNNNATISYIYVFPGNQLVYLLGQEVFSTLSVAISAAGSESTILPGDLADGALLLARVINRKGATDITDLNDSQIIASTAVSSGGGTVTTLLQAYEAGSEPEIIVNTTRGAFSVRDNIVPINAPLTEVQNSAGTRTYWSTSATACRTQTQAYSEKNILSDTATIATDCALGNVHEITLGGARTLGAPTNLKPGATYIWFIIQDVTGSRTLAYNSVFKFAGDVTPVLAGTLGKLQILSGVSDGTNIYCNLSAEYTQ